MSHPSITAIVEALEPFAGGPGTPFPKPEDFRRAADAVKGTTVLAEYVRGLEEALREGRRAIGEHSAPHDCYATGPSTGDPIRDLAECPACSFLAMYDAALSGTKP